MSVPYGDNSPPFISGPFLLVECPYLSIATGGYPG
ncbi:hypothetical protein Holit_03277 [Hollandina sp. SP2]